MISVVGFQWYLAVFFFFLSLLWFLWWQFLVFVVVVGGFAGLSGWVCSDVSGSGGG